MDKTTQKEIRHYAGAAGIFIIVVGLLLFLSFNQIPTENKDLFVSIVGVISGSLSVILFTIIGRNPTEVQDLKNSNEKLEGQVAQLIQQKDELEGMLIEMQKEIVDKLSIAGVYFELKKNGKEPKS
jgi:ABC-type enterochelin transport system permease subunit